MSVKEDTTEKNTSHATLTERIKMIIEKKETKIAKLRKQLAIEEEIIEGECIQQVRALVDEEKETGEEESERFIVVDEVDGDEEVSTTEMAHGNKHSRSKMRNRDLRENVPRILYLSKETINK